MARIVVPPQAFKEFNEGETLVSPGWHSFEITKVEEKSSKDGQSTNYWIYFKCLDEGFTNRKGLRTLFNEKSFEPDKAKYEVIPFILALDDSLDAKTLQQTGITVGFDDTLVGRRLKARIAPEEYNGRMSEKFKGWARISDNV